jgi:dTDP-4-amino-4,6-dideoxygalactose transaminase
MQPIQFIGLKAQQKHIRHKIDTAIQKVLDHGIYIMGPEVEELETKLSLFCGAKHTISCSNGTDAIAFALMCKNIKAGDHVIVPSFTFAATAEVIVWFNAIPIFVDVDFNTFNICPDHLEATIQDAKQKGKNVTGIITVDLFGQPVDYESINKIAQKHDLWIIDDAAQGFGGNLKGQKIGTLAELTTTSFFPVKPLGCYGDGGAIFTNNDEYAALMRSIRVHGQGSNKYDNVRIGMNGRLDTIQAAILLEKLAIFDEELTKRNQIAQRYTNALKDYAQTPHLTEGAFSTWAQYTLTLPNRNEVAASLKERGIPTFIYYPMPLNLQTAYKHYPTGPNGTPNAEKLAQQVLSLPIHPYLDEKTQDYIITQTRAILLKKVA